MHPDTPLMWRMEDEERSLRLDGSFLEEGLRGREVP
jgi:hypothetical protein